MMSRTGIHALAAAAALARLEPGAYAGAGDIARETGAPRNYLGKLLKTLAGAGLLESRKGKGGGFRLARAPARISLLDVIGRIERTGRWSGCILSGGRCSPRAPCAAHARWARVRDAYLGFLSETTVADLASRKGTARERAARRRRR